MLSPTTHRFSALTAVLSTVRMGSQAQKGCHAIKSEHVWSHCFPSVWRKGWSWIHYLLGTGSPPLGTYRLMRPQQVLNKDLNSHEAGGCLCSKHAWFTPALTQEESCLESRDIAETLNFTDSMTKSISFFCSDAFYPTWKLDTAKLQLAVGFTIRFF